MPLKIEQRKLSTLTPDPRNARRHGTRNLELIADSLTTHGQVRPILVDKDGLIIAGNGTFTAAQELGWTSIDCVIFTGSAALAKAYALADNRTAETAEWDNETLLATLSEFDDDLLRAATFTRQEYDDLHQLWGTAPSLDDLADEVGDVNDDDRRVRIVLQLEPDVAELWKMVCASTGMTNPDDAATAVIRAAHAGVTSGV